ncbi:MAG: HIT domain-containing protein [Syntrophobacteraceae bacterium]
MKNLWAPWRIEYILGDRDSSCIFCPQCRGLSDEERLILYRDGAIMVMMNRFPYNNGHLLVSPLRHVSRLDDLNDDEMFALILWVKKSSSILEEVMHPDGFNIGLNLGKEAGAGYDEHLHFHVVPRWRGDTNFMAVLTEVRSIPEHIKQTYSKLLPYYSKESANEAV